jgi:hypothetical protein
MWYWKAVKLCAAILCASASLVTLAHAQASVCESLLRQGIRDTSTTHITKSRFVDIRSHVCNSNYDSYAKASSAALSGGFDIPGLFGINAGSANAANEYSTKWSAFCNATYTVSRYDDKNSLYLETLNATIQHSFDNCIEKTTERFIRYVEPSQDGKTFTIIFRNTFAGVGGFKIIQLTLRDTDTGKNLDLANDCDLHDALPFDTKGNNSWNIVCQKSEHHTVIINAITSFGTISPVTVPSIALPRPITAEQIGRRIDRRHLRRARRI